MAIDAGGIVLDGSPATVFDDPRLAGIGVEPPSRARLARAIAAAGFDASVVDAVLREPAA